MEAKEVILAGSRWRIGTGNDIAIIGQPWLENKGNRFVTNSSPSIVNQSVNSLMSIGQKECDWDLITDIFNERDWQCIQVTQIETGLDRDVLQWEGELTGQYTVKNAYRLMQSQKETNAPHNSSKLWKSLWQIKVSQKALNLVWRALSHCLPTKTQLQQKRVQVDNICTVCKKEVETTSHTLIYCPFAANC